MLSKKKKNGKRNNCRYILLSVISLTCYSLPTGKSHVPNNRASTIHDFDPRLGPLLCSLPLIRFFLLSLSLSPSPRYASDLYLNEWIRPNVDVGKWEFYDLSCKARDNTDDKVLKDAIAAGKRIGAIFKVWLLSRSLLFFFTLSLSCNRHAWANSHLHARLHIARTKKKKYEFQFVGSFTSS